MNREYTAIRTHFFIITALAIAAIHVGACQPSEQLVESPNSDSGMASVNNVELYYTVQGEGIPLLLLHGGLGHSGNWENQLGVLADHYRVITVDSRGHGRSTMTDQQISYPLMASDIVALMDFLNIPKAHILGWSDGGNIGLYLAIHHPDRLIKVIASGANYSPSGVRSDVGENPKFVSYIGKAMEDYQALSPNPTNWEAFLGNISQMWATEPDLTADQLGNIGVPVLLLDGESDEAIYTEHTKEMASLIPTSELKFVSGTGHFGLWDRPAEMNLAILEFLNK